MNDREDFRKSFKENNRDQKSCSPVRSKLQLLTLVKYIYIYIYMFELQYVLSFCLDPEKTEENRRKTSFITKNKLKTLKSFSLS
jgi:hypothetical protein